MLYFSVSSYVKGTIYKKKVSALNSTEIIRTFVILQHKMAAILKKSYPKRVTTPHPPRYLSRDVTQQ